MPQQIPGFVPDAPQPSSPGAIPGFVPDAKSFNERAQPTQGPLPLAQEPWHQMPDQGPTWWDNVKQNYAMMQNPHMGRGGGANLPGTLDQMAQKGSEIGGNIGRGIRMPGEVPGYDQPSYDPGPQIQGASAAVGGLVGGMAADPRQIGLMAGMGGASAPLRAAADVGFGAQMGYGANQQAGELGKVIDNPNVPTEQKWEMGSSAVLQTLMAASSGAGAHGNVMEGLRPHLSENIPGFVPDSADPGTQSGIQEPRLDHRQQAPTTAMPSRPAGSQVGPTQMPNTGVEGGPSPTMASSQMGGASVGQPKAMGVKGPEDSLPAHMIEGFVPDAQPSQASPTTGPQQAPVQATPGPPARGRKGPVVDNTAPIQASVALTTTKPSIEAVAARPPQFSEGSTPEVYRTRKSDKASPGANEQKTPPRRVEDVVKSIGPSSRPKRLGDEELKSLVGLGEKGARDIGLSRDDFLAARAEARRRFPEPSAKTAEAKAPEPGEGVHQAITRIAKASDEADRGRRQSEFLETIKGLPEEHRQAASESLGKRSESTAKQIKEIERIRDSQDFAKEVSATRHASELVATGGPEQEFDESGQPIKQKFQRQFPIGDEERQYLGYLAGNRQERFKFLRDEGGKAIKTGPLDPERQKFADDIRDRLERHRAEVLAQPGGRPTEAQKAEGIKLVTGLQAATGKRQLYSGKGQEGLDPDRAYWNKLIGRPETSHFAKPDAETLERRLRQLRDESEVSKMASEHLRGERRGEQPGTYQGPERRKTWSEIDKENRGPSEGEKLGKEIRAARAEKPSGLSEGEVRQRIMRDPVKYEAFRKADRKTQDAMLVKASREEPKEAPKSEAPQEAPVDATKARASEDLKQAYDHLVNLHRKGLGDTEAAKRARAAVAELKPHAPDVKVPAELEASEVLRAAEGPKKSRVIGQESTTPEAPKTGLSDALWEKLRKSEDVPGALQSAIYKLHGEDTSVVAKEDRDNLAYQIPDKLSDMETARRYGGALKIAGDDLKAGRGLERAENFARTGSQKIEPKKGQEGFLSLGGKKDPRVTAAEKAQKEERPKTLLDALNKGRQMTKALGKWYTGANTGQKLSDALKGREPQEAFKSVLGEYLSTRQKGRFFLNALVEEGRREIKSPHIREAITNYIQAGGDSKLLAQRASAHPNKALAVGYDNATKLTTEEKAWAARLKSDQDDILKVGQQMGILEHGLENYMTQIWQKNTDAVKGLMSQLQAGKLNSSFRYARKRLYDSYFEGEMGGKTPKNKDALFLHTTYMSAMNDAIGARKFWKDLWKTNLKDGSPALVPEGKWGRVMSKDPRVAYAIPLHAKGIGRLMDKTLADALGTTYDAAKMLSGDKVRSDTSKYERVDHPSARKWVFSLKASDGTSVYIQTDALAHPDIAQHLENLYKKSWFQTFAPTRYFLKGQALAKQTLLGVPGFHYVQEGFHAAFHKVNPFDPNHWTGQTLRDGMDHPLVDELMHNGLMVYDRESMQKFGEGLTGLSKLPGVGYYVARMQEHLFNTYIPSLKVAMGKKAFQRNLEHYKTDLASGKVTRQQLLETTAAQANAAFGELNYEWMGRSKTAQDLFRMAALAPDFLEARGRFVGQALRPYGHEQRMALLLRAGVYQWIAARTLNMVLNQGKSYYDDPDMAFKVKVGQRSYGLRSVPSDLMHLAKLFKGDASFFLYRTAPALRLAIQAGAEYFGGRKLTAKDVLKESAPIPIQGFIEDRIRKNQPNDKKALDKALEGLGVQSQKYHTPQERESIERNQDDRQRRMRGERVPFRRRPSSGLVSPGRTSGLTKF